jgi:predicted transcriptional regulator
MSPNTPGTPRRTIRVPDALWIAAAEQAKEQGTDVSAVIRKALERFVKRR